MDWILLYACNCRRIVGAQVATRYIVVDRCRLFCTSKHCRTKFDLAWFTRVSICFSSRALRNDDWKRASLDCAMPNGLAFAL